MDRNSGNNQVSSPRGQLYEIDEPDVPLSHDAIRRLRGASGAASVTICNRGHLDLALNWYLNFRRAAPSERPYVVATSRDGALGLRARGASALVFEPATDLDVTDHLVRFREDFRWSHLVCNKIDLTNLLLRAGVDVFYTDTDVVLMRDVTTEMRTIAEGSDVAFQVNHRSKLCSGVYYANPTAGSRKLFDRFDDELQPFDLLDPHFGDQLFLQRRVAEASNDLAVQYLPTSLAPTGHYWYPNRAALRDQVGLVHYNCLRERDDKVAEMKADGVWAVTD